MKREGRDNTDDLFRAKLHDFEVETAQEDWDAIEKRLACLPVSPVGAEKDAFPFYRRRSCQWMAAAAAVAALLVLSLGTLRNERENGQAEMARNAREEAAGQANGKELAAAVAGNHADTASRPLLLAARTRTDEEPAAGVFPKGPVAGYDGFDTERIEAREPAVPAVRVEERFLSEAKPVREEGPGTESRHEPRKWAFGMGTGSLTAGNSGSGGAFALKGLAVLNDNSSMMNAISAFDQLPKADVKHKMPLSFGLSASRRLTDRWSLQAGLSYSYLVSEWTTDKTYRADSEQRLHFLGIPVAVTCKIAEWNRFSFYASAGGQVELNVAGKVCTDLYSPDGKLKSVTEKERMEEPYFSVNGRVGVSYPVVRFVSAYAEVGADYYFDNGSDMETIHSEKPFYVGLQFGFRFGF